MIFQAVLIFFIFQIGQELILADDFFDRNAFENFIQKKDGNKVELSTNSMEQMVPQIETVMENYSNKIVTDVDKSFQAELKSMAKDLKIFSNRSFNSTTEYLKKIIKREIESVKTIMKTIYRVLDAEKGNFKDEITRGLRNMSRAKVEIVKNILKDELDESARAELNELKISVKNELRQFARTELDYFKNNVKNEIIESSKNEFGLLKTFIITQLSFLKNAMENSYIRNSKQSTCELTKSAIESIKTITEKSDNPSDDDSNLEQHMSKLEDKFERVLLRLESKNSTCKFDEQTKSTFESLKSISEKLNHPDNNNNEICQKFEKVSEELSKNLTIGFNRVNIKVNSMKKSVSGKVITSSKTIDSTVRGALTSELDKFSNTQLKTMKITINDTLAGILETELESLKSTFKNQLKEQVGILKGKLNELAIKPETLATQVSIESLNSTINQIHNKLSREFDKNTNDILNAINKTLIGYVKNDTSGVTETTAPEDDSKGLNRTLPVEKEEIIKGGKEGSSKKEGGASDGGVSISTTTEKTEEGDPDKDGGDPDGDGGDPDGDGGDSDKDGGDPDGDGGDSDKDGKDPDGDGGDSDKDGEDPDGDGGDSDKDGEDPDGDGGDSDKDGEDPDGDGGETPDGGAGLSSKTKETVGDKDSTGGVIVSSTTEETVEDGGETPDGGAGLSSKTKETVGDKDSTGGVIVSSTTEETVEDGGETPDGGAVLSSKKKETVGDEGSTGGVIVSSTTEETVEDGGETPDGGAGLSSKTKETVGDKGSAGGVIVSSSTEGTGEGKGE